MLEKLFKLKENKTTAKTEVIAGLTTFMTMAYIIALNPNLLTGFGAEGKELWNGVFLATCIASAIGIFVMAFVANKPFAMAPGMGLNSFFAIVVANIVGLTGMTYLFIAHDLSIVRFISDRIVVIYKGKIMEIAESEELFNYPLHPYTKSLISAIPIPDPMIEKEKKLLVYDPSMHDYSSEKPELTDIGNGHMVYGSPSELEKYKQIRFGGK